MAATPLTLLAMLLKPCFCSFMHMLMAMQPLFRVGLWTFESLFCLYLLPALSHAAPPVQLAPCLPLNTCYLPNHAPLARLC
jgi:hypothetical protein